MYEKNQQRFQLKSFILVKLLSSVEDEEIELNIFLLEDDVSQTARINEAAGENVSVTDVAKTDQNVEMFKKEVYFLSFFGQRPLEKKIIQFTYYLIYF